MDASREMQEFLANMPKSEDVYSDYKRRHIHIDEYGFVVVTPALVEALKPYCVGRVEEVMAGSGHLSAALRFAGVTLRASDDLSWEHQKWQHHTQVVMLDAAVAAVGADTVIMVWPYMDDGAHRVATAMKSGSSLIYCGEWTSGCTANDDFFALIDTWQEDEEFGLKINPHHYRWWGIHDYWYRYIKP